MMQTKCDFRICPLGAHIDHQKGFVIGFTINKGITIDYESSDSPILILKSEFFQDQLALNIRDEIDLRGDWTDCFTSTIKELKRLYAIKNGILGVVKSDLNFMGGLSSSSASIISFAKALLQANQRVMTDAALIELVYKIEHDYMGLKVGILDPSCQLLARNHKLLFLDTQTKEYHHIDFSGYEDMFEILIIHTGQNRNLNQTAYNQRVLECNLAVEALSCFSKQPGAETFRDISIQTYQNHKHQMDENLHKRAKHYYEEVSLVLKGLNYWQQGNIEAFGKLVLSSCESSLYNYESGTKEVTDLFHMIKDMSGVYGGRLLGGGFHGNFFVMIKKEQKDEITEHITSTYQALYPESIADFQIIDCQMSGVL